MSFISSLSGAKILIFGAGVTGKPSEEFLRTHGALVTVIDEHESAASAKRNLDGLDLTQFQFALVSPGWRKNHPLINQARDAGLLLRSEIDLAWMVKEELAPSQRWIGLTGTNGKTTTVQMTESILRESGINARACGNVGETVIDAVSSTEADVLVLELSSFQLEWSSLFELESAAILNIAEDHLDWHGSFDAYASAKFKICQRTKIAILNAADPQIMKRARDLSKRIVYFSLETPANHEVGLVENLIVDRAFVSGDAEVLFELSDITPAVPHNVLNAMAAATLARSLGAQSSAVARALREFKLDHHRLETVANKGEVIWIDDSKATNPHAALAAILSQPKVIWIAGGLAKGASMDELVLRGKSRIKSAILYGTDAPLIDKALLEYAPEIERVNINSELKGVDLMRAVVKSAAERAKPGDTVLLAPACASMDRFKNYAERGELFAAAVKELLNDGK